MLFIGIDLGTSAVKLLLMDENGNIRKIVSKEYPLFFPHPGWSEQHPEDWMNAIWNGIPELLAGEDAAQVAGIGAGGQMHGLVALDKNDCVLRPAILWNDGRSQEETDYLNQVIGKETLSAYTGNIAFAGFTAPKILWMKKNEPELFSKIAKIMLPKDYVNYMLTGVHCTDYSDAAGMLLLDVKNKCWSREMLEICGIAEAQMPRLFESAEVVGELCADAAEKLGLAKTVKVVAGAGDNAAAAVGTATVGEGTCNISLGTSGTIFISSQSFRVDSANALHAFAHADGGYHLLGCMLSAASCNKWWIENILQSESYAKESEGITDEKLGSQHIFYLPYLMGERAPHNDPAARSCFLGMTMDTTREDLTQAVMEGVSFGIRDMLEAARDMGIRVESSMLCGGGAKSLLWRRILANILNLELQIPETEQGPGYGAAMLAAVGCGAFESVADATRKLIRITGTISPETDIAARYEKKYQIFRELYPTLKNTFSKLV